MIFLPSFLRTRITGMGHLAQLSFQGQAEFSWYFIFKQPFMENRQTEIQSCRTSSWKPESGPKCWQASHSEIHWGAGAGAGAGFRCWAGWCHAQAGSQKFSWFFCWTHCSSVYQILSPCLSFSLPFYLTRALRHQGPITFICRSDCAHGWGRIVQEYLGNSVILEADKALDIYFRQEKSRLLTVWDFTYCTLPSFLP